MLSKPCFAFAFLCASAQLACSAVLDETSQTTFVFIDTETTGFSAETDRIIELGAVKWRDGKVLATRAWLINPGRPIPGQATDVHGITDKMVINSPSFADVYPEFSAFIADSVLVAHNAPFDIRHLSAEATRHGLSLPENAVLDTRVLARKQYPKAPGHSLSVLKAHLQLDHHNTHRAREDALLTKSLFAVILKDSPESTVSNLMMIAGQHFSPPSTTPPLP